MKEERVFIPSAAIQLEGLLNVSGAFPFKKGAIFCHPHPLYGGDMYNSVITVAVEAATQEGFSTLRFNFRGVGESGGSYGEGIGEREDVLAVTEYISLKLQDSNPSLVLIGYSFGAWAGFPMAIQDRRFKGLAAIAPPLELYDFGFLKGCKKKKLIIGGSQDLFCPASLLEEWFQSLEEPKSLSIISGADHFYFHTHLLTQPLSKFFKEMSLEM